MYITSLNTQVRRLKVGLLDACPLISNSSASTGSCIEINHKFVLSCLAVPTIAASLPHC